VSGFRAAKRKKAEGLYGLRSFNKEMFLHLAAVVFAGNFAGCGAHSACVGEEVSARARRPG
jgi:hypothetical protein